MAKKKKAKIKFSFGIDFQEQILQFIVTDPKGPKALSLLDDEYFVSIPHAIICFALKKYFKQKGTVAKKAYLREYLRTMYQGGYRALSNVTDGDRAEVSQIVDRLYEAHAFDGDTIIEKVINFAKWVKFKEQIESSDVNNFESYESQVQKFNDILNIGKEIEVDHGIFLVEGMQDRAHRRNSDHDSFPTPFWQLNKTMNSHGTHRGNIITVISQEKRFKTGFLINVARGYLKMRKRGVYFDLENGKVAITVRTEQSFSSRTREEIISEKFDNNLLKLFRKYKRLGAELNIQRFSALTATTDAFQAHLDRLKAEFGFAPDFCIVDYGPLMASKSGKTDDFSRISDAFIDLKNFAEKNAFEALWTVAHVVREADKRRGTKYEPKDIAKCIDIPRHVDMLLGLQESEEEKEHGVMRLEIIEQRDGTDGRALFWVDFKTQRLKEFTKAEVKDYMDQIRSRDDGDDDAPFKADKPKKQRKTDV